VSKDTALSAQKQQKQHTLLEASKEGLIVQIIVEAS
jgi:hypothetical protein